VTAREPAADRDASVRAYGVPLTADMSAARDREPLAEPLPVDRRGEVDTTALVIGTGFGGAVTAARLAERLGTGVLVIERGREVLPGQFPDTLTAVAAEVRGPANPLGQFDVRLGRDLNVVGANGLGGGSMHYAAVTLPPDDNVFEAIDPATGRRVWPRAVDGRALRRYYAAIRSMLAVEVWTDVSDVERGGPPTPSDLLTGSPVADDVANPAATRARDVFGHLPRERPALPKGEPVRRFAEKLGMPCYRPPLAINLTHVPDGGRNAHNVLLGLCTHCGSCVTGCNFGAMNSLTTNYLPYAKSEGARICVGVEALRIRPGRRRRWMVDAIHRTLDGGRPRARRVLLHADIVVVAAGAAGSTELMLRSRRRSLPLSPALGTRISGNGDALALSFDGNRELGAIGPPPVPPPGPTITLTVDITTGTDRSLIQDGGFPPLVLPRIGRALAIVGGKWRAALRSEEAAAALARSQVWLAMGTDSAAGEADLDRRGRLRIRWPDVNTAPAQLQRESWLVDLIRLQQADPLLTTPDERKAAKRAALTVHLLGGCPMADDPYHGVVDSAGRVYQSADRLHEGLYIVDGSTCPTSMGVNPSLAIAALAEHAFALGWAGVR
jgi:cholesterol oxidase